MSSVDAMESFWDKFENHPAMENHPLLDRPGYKRTCVPLETHGDEVPVVGIGKVWSRSALNFSWCSIIAVALGGATKDVMIYIWGVFEQIVVEGASGGPGTMEVFFEIMRWSFEALFQGKWPAKDWRGVELLGVMFTCAYLC